MYDYSIIGGGIVGLATALEIKKQSPYSNIILFEKEKKISEHQTGRNSGVIHSGIYYKPNSLKAINCINGYNLLIDFCKKNKINFDMCGKIILATDKSELKTLENLFIRGKKNGLKQLKLLDREEIKKYEPYANGIKAIYVPQTGIVDYRKVSQVILNKIKKMNVKIKLNSEVISIKTVPNWNIIKTNNEEYKTKSVINCAGLFTDRITKLTSKVNYKIIPFRGEYYKLKRDKRYLVKNLIYPVPDENFPFLGVHFTKKINGEVEAGPNAVLAFAKEGYKFTDINFIDLFDILFFKGFWKIIFKYWRTGLIEMKRSLFKREFTRALQKLIPEISEDDLVASNAGVRAQLCDSDGNLIDDFLIKEDNSIVNVLNAPSPAATSAFSIAKIITKKILK